MVIELFLIGVGLSMDAFAVSVCKGLGMEKINKKHAFLIGLYFGGFQALMPFLGWALGIRFQKYITSVDHWIAFFLLLFIGGKMVIEAVRDKDVQEIGVGGGNSFGTRYKRNAEIAGGVILILIGLKILLEHLGIIAF